MVHADNGQLWSLWASGFFLSSFENGTWKDNERYRREDSFANIWNLLGNTTRWLREYILIILILFHGSSSFPKDLKSFRYLHSQCLVLMVCAKKHVYTFLHFKFWAWQTINLHIVNLGLHQVTKNQILIFRCCYALNVRGINYSRLRVGILLYQVCFNWNLPMRVLHNQRSSITKLWNSEIEPKLNAVRIIA